MRVAITLKTNDGETLDYVALREPLPETHQWQGRTFRRVEGTTDYVEEERVP